MSDPTYVTAFEDHAKRASVGLPGAVVRDLPFGVDEELGVRRSDGGGVAVAVDPDRSDPSAVVRETEQGVRLYLDRMTVYEAGLLDGEVELAVREGGLHVSPVE
ncbi:MAG: hypothetical protein ABEJ34_00760 [Haloferacaceae archaeon]